MGNINAWKKEDLRSNLLARYPTGRLRTLETGEKKTKLNQWNRLVYSTLGKTVNLPPMVASSTCLPARSYACRAMR